MELTELLSVPALLQTHLSFIQIAAIEAMASVGDRLTAQLGATGLVKLCMRTSANA
mgnify:CR=1 FL=1